MLYDPILANQPLIAEIEAFCESKGLTTTAFGLAAINDGALVSGLRRGRQIRQDTLFRLRHFMAEYEETGSAA